MSLCFHLQSPPQNFVNKMGNIYTGTWWKTLLKGLSSGKISTQTILNCCPPWKMLNFSPWKSVWYEMKTSGSLPLSEGSLLGKSLLEEQIVTLTHTQLHKHTIARKHGRTHTHAASPLRELLTEAALPVTVAAIILQVLSPDRLLQVSALLTTSVSTHTHSHTLYIVMGTHVWLHTPGCAFHPQFTLCKLMARTNRNDVLAHTSCSSQEKHTSLRGCGRSRKRAPYTSSVIEKCIIKDETAKRSV